jgi:hypothetical protein
MAIGPWAAVGHEAVEVRMRGVALELAQGHAARPDVRAALPVEERARRMLRQGEPEADLLGPGGHVVAVDVVRIGDPERRHVVVGRDQDIGGVLAGQDEVLAVRRHEWAEVGRLTRFAVGMALGQDSEVVNELVAGFHGVFEEEAVTHRVEGHVVFHPHVVGAVHRHAAAVGVVDR